MHFAGAQIGNVVSMGASGLLIHYLGGWTSVFYTFGVLGLAWLCLWMSFASSDPDQCSRLSEYERKYLLATMGHLKQKTKQVGRGGKLPGGVRNRQADVVRCQMVSKTGRQRLPLLPYGFQNRQEQVARWFSKQIGRGCQMPDGFRNRFFFNASDLPKL